MVASVASVNLDFGTSLIVSDVSAMAMPTHVTPTRVSVMSVVTIQLDQTVLCVLEVFMVIHVWMWALLVDGAHVLVQKTLVTVLLLVAPLTLEPKMLYVNVKKVMQDPAVMCVQVTTLVIQRYQVVVVGLVTATITLIFLGLEIVMHVLGSVSSVFSTLMDSTVNAANQDFMVMLSTSNAENVCAISWAPISPLVYVIMRQGSVHVSLKY